jgi:hypothetical protein
MPATSWDILELTCTVVWDTTRSSMVHERIARVLISAIHVRGVALVGQELESVVRQGSFVCQQKEEMN